MTSQNKKRWLIRYRDIDDEIDELLDERRRWMEVATKITATGGDGMPGGGSERGALENAAIKCADISAQIDSKISEMVMVRREIRKSISHVRDHRYRRLLRLHYISGMTFEEVADKMHYTVRWILKMHGQALAAVRINEDIVVHDDE